MGRTPRLPLIRWHIGRSGESRLAPFFRDGLEVDPQDVVGREVNPRIPVAALIGPENNRKNVTDPLLSRRGWPTDPARKAIG